MIIAALVDLGVPASVVADALAALPISGFHLHFGTRVRSGIVATRSTFTSTRPSRSARTRPSARCSRRPRSARG